MTSNAAHTVMDRFKLYELRKVPTMKRNKEFGHLEPLVIYITRNPASRASKRARLVAVNSESRKDK